MSDMIAADLHKLIIKTCDNLYAGRQLITKTVVKNVATSYGIWSEQELDLYVPRYINEWRLRNLAEDQSIQNADKIVALEAQLSKYRSNLLDAKRTITKLRADMVRVSIQSQQHRAKLIEELRALLKSQH